MKKVINVVEFSGVKPCLSFNDAYELIYQEYFKHLASDIENNKVKSCLRQRKPFVPQYKRRW